jgi:peptide/nickel transport system permease protein
MSRYIIRRLLAYIPSLLIISLLVALMIDLIPGDPAELLVGREASGEAVIQKRAQLGLDRPMYERVGRWLVNALQGNLGDSYFLNQPVSQTIADRYGVTIWLAVLSLIIGSVVGIFGGILASTRQGHFADWTTTASALLWLSVPSFLVALTLIYIFAVRLDWLPIGGFVSPFDDLVEFSKHIILPALAMGLGYAGIIARFARTSLLEVLRTDYVRTARAKGLRETAVLIRHALKNALIPILTVIGIGFGELLGGAVVIESAFAMPGVGRMVLDAVKRRDYPVIQGGLLVVTVTYLTVNLLVDLLYAWIDPRIRYD